MRTLAPLLVAAFLLAGCASPDYDVTPMPEDTPIDAPPADSEFVSDDGPITYRGTTTVTEVRACPLTPDDCPVDHVQSYHIDGVPVPLGRFVTVTVSWDNADAPLGLNVTLFNGRWGSDHSVIYQVEGVSPLEFTVVGTGDEPAGIGIHSAFQPASALVGMTVYWKAVVVSGS